MLIHFFGLYLTKWCCFVQTRLSFRRNSNKGLMSVPFCTLKPKFSICWRSDIKPSSSSYCIIKMPISLWSFRVFSNKGGKFAKRGSSLSATSMLHWTKRNNFLFFISFKSWHLAKECLYEKFSPLCSLRLVSVFYNLHHSHSHKSITVKTFSFVNFRLNSWSFLLLKPTETSPSVRDGRTS